MKKFFSMYSFGYQATLVYMLQVSEYKTKTYLRWHRRLNSFSNVMYRGSLKKTLPALALLYTLRVGMFIQVAFGTWMAISGFKDDDIIWIITGVLLMFTYPFLWTYLILVPLELGRIFLIKPRDYLLVRGASSTFMNHRATKIAVVGSYGKTSMKELLVTVLSEGKKIAAPTGNKNVPVSIARFTKRLTGDEEILVIEFGEGEPGDVENFSKMTQPDIAIITGIAPAHLDEYPTLEAAGEDIFSVANHVDSKSLYVNGESQLAKQFIKDGVETYDSKNVLGWKISDVSIGFDGTKFIMKKNNQVLKLHSALVGKHQVGPLGLVVALADKLGLTKEQIESGIGNTTPHEHRMQPRFINGAWIIDDTYNGNIEGMKAGLELLGQLPGKKKTYVTPGLVDQGVETEDVHMELGRAIAKANPDEVVLMNNSVTGYIKSGLVEGNYSGILKHIDDPLEYYTNIEHHLSAGNVVLMQNDWPDQYN